MKILLFMAIAILVLGALFGFQLYLLLRESEGPQPPSTPPRVVYTPLKETVLTVEDQQITEDRITIKEIGVSVNQSTPGYVVIHLSENEKPGKILGHSLYYIYPGSMLRNLEIEVSGLESGANKLFAMVHSDNGDGSFDPSRDLPIRVGEKLIVQPLTITKGP